MALYRKRKTHQPDTAAIVVAAGSASRMGGIDKQMALIGEAPVLAHSLRALEACPSVGQIVVVARQERIPLLHRMIKDFGFTKIGAVITGGDTRQQSVAKGFEAIGPQYGFVAIHDGARPLLRPEEAERCIEAARQTGAACLGAPVKDTIKQVDGKGKITATPDRSTLFAAYTPQVFSVAAYGAAMEKAAKASRDFTDDCQLMEFAGLPVQMVTGSYDNIKITTPEDLAVAAGLLAFRAEWEEGEG